MVAVTRIPRPKVLVSSLMMSEEATRFREELDEFEIDFVTSGQFLTEKEILSYLDENGQIQGWISGDDVVTEEVLKLAHPELRVISKWGSGLDSIDVVAAQRIGIPVFNSPGDIATAVGEVAVGYAINLLRGLSIQDANVRRGEWIKPMGLNLAGTKVGILGYGRIGKKLESMLMGFGADAQVSDPAFPSISVDLVNMLRNVRVLFICAPLTDATRGIISAESLGEMQDGAFIVNVSRGPIVREEDLIDALGSGKLAGAALDVFEQEPPPVSSKLMTMPNVVLGCHNANNSVQSRESVHKEAIANLRRILIN